MQTSNVEFEACIQSSAFIMAPSLTHSILRFFAGHKVNFVLAVHFTIIIPMLVSLASSSSKPQYPP